MAARESFDSYVRRGAVPDAMVALKAAAVDEQKFLDLCAGLSAKALSEGRATSHYTWRTVGDGKVRDGHVALAGQVFSWSSPPEGGHPGTAHNCRCWAEPYYGDPSVPDSLLQLSRTRGVLADPTHHVASIDMLSRPDGSVAASTIGTRDGNSITSVFQGASVSQRVSFADGSYYQSLRLGEAREISVQESGETRLRVAWLRRTLMPDFFPPVAPPTHIPASPERGDGRSLVTIIAAPAAEMLRGALELYNSAVIAPEPMGVGPGELPVLAIKIWQGVGGNGATTVTKEALTAEQVAQTCKLLPEVQEWVDKAALELSVQRVLMTAQDIGIKIHLAVHETVKALKLQFLTRYGNIWSELQSCPVAAVVWILMAPTMDKEAQPDST